MAARSAPNAMIRLNSAKKRATIQYMWRRRYPWPIALIVVCCTFLRHPIYLAMKWLFTHTASWLLRYFTLTQLYAIAGLLLVTAILLYVRNARRQAHTNLIKLVSDDMLRQVDLARNPPVDPLRPTGQSGTPRSE